MLIMLVWCECWGGQHELWRGWRSTTKHGWTHSDTVRAVAGFGRLQSLWKPIHRPAFHASWALCDGVSCEREWRVRGGHCCREMSEMVWEDGGEGGRVPTGDCRLDATMQTRNSETLTRRGKEMYWCILTIRMTVILLTAHYRLWPFVRCMWMVFSLRKDCSKGFNGPKSCNL